MSADLPRFERGILEVLDPFSGSSQGHSEVYHLRGNRKSQDRPKKITSSSRLVEEKKLRTISDPNESWNEAIDGHPGFPDW